MMSAVIEAFRSALDSMNAAGPKPLSARARALADDLPDDAQVTAEALVDYLHGVGVNDGTRIAFHIKIAGWDSIDTAPWTDDTEPYTHQRRERTYEALQLDPVARKAFNEFFPTAVSGGTVISDTFERWYTDERQQQRRYYWTVYSDHLQKVRRWSPEGIVRLDKATTQVVERLSDPTRKEAYQAKGLVVGYVQSGKTANFTGVIAKAIDAGYRLVIVMTGTVDLLRQQTQRRLDMELVGVENILGGVDLNDPEMADLVDYQQDKDWHSGKFVQHGFRPSEKDLPDIVRLTTSRNDYRRLNTGIAALDVARAVKSKPLWAPDNLYASDTRLIVVKKNGPVLTKLVKDLKSITQNLADIPVLIIDDESDQASVNTSNPARWKADQRERTKINGLISQILQLLPRAQYVGYTATPFANVFIDPSDVEDIFPKDFLISLERPIGYMGVSDFHDLDVDLDAPDRHPANSHEVAFVRPLVGQSADERQDDLTRAIDAYVLAGAVKLYRRDQRGDPELYPHHTMLVHESVRMVEHRDTRDHVLHAWRTRAYSSAAGLDVLRELYDNDFLPVSRARADGESFPEHFEDLVPYVGQAVARIAGGGGDPVLIVNGDKDLAQEALDFDAHGVWRILVGGTKLSRGFTVEGLTSSYYRRRTDAADTLMQMGRWFGFRAGYQDLVRLYIGRRERSGTKFDDLYAKFEAIVRDEEAFREQLRQYAKPVDGEPQIRPDQIPPLVSQHLPSLRPTARTKMFNAELTVRRSPGTPIEPTGYPTNPKALDKNYDVMAPLLAAADKQVTLRVPDKTLQLTPTTFSAYQGLVKHKTVLATLKRLGWLTKEYFRPDLAYLAELDGQVDDWLLLAPQVKGTPVDLPSVGLRSVHVRERRRAPMYGAISDPKHRRAGLAIATTGGGADPAAQALASPRRGVLVLYPLVDPVDDPLTTATPSKIVPAFVVITPMAAMGTSRQLVTFRAHNNAVAKAIIDAIDGEDD